MIADKLVHVCGTLVDKWKLIERTPKLAELIQNKMTILHGSQTAGGMTHLYYARVLFLELVWLAGAGGLAASTGDWTLWFGGGVLMVPLLGYASYRDIDKQLLHRRRRLLMELPLLLDKIVLLLHAGETVHGALMRCMEARTSTDKEIEPLYQELSHVKRELALNGSFSESMTQFSKCCSLPEVAQFCMMLQIQHKRGGSELVQSLQLLSMELWVKRKQIARTIGEEASAKMVFPMTAIFLIVMLVVAAPAVMMMNGL